MRTPERIILALYGLSCTGKSTIARKLAALLGLPLRSASAEIRKRSSELNIAPNALSEDEHKKIDNVTRALASNSARGMVIEGNFLDALLADTSGVIRVELKCADAERQQRLAERENSHGLNSRDADNQRLRSVLHGDKTSSPHFSIDTTTKNADAVVEEILSWLRSTNLNAKLD